ncbi:MAG: 4-hydroxy-tetrahydrodipicolinate synthase [Rhodospirillaceae bacterium TMED8]|nr:4-hydroxy-tetrahydrodipicolinate synthase [Magnetovibrio sp.]OUT51606.1 MAG: 4-hydroxy-tetrahydrodipicolinate synthase [Rhodospirillaceae bacterium TMED8]|tara:strand:- start:6 stop:881 length:876 start_codon:yes stop_codon:yes gene_type:complete
MFKGSFPALITPFRGGNIDEDSFREIVDWQIYAGTDGLVPCGTTGESPTLTHAEHMRVTEMCIEQARGRVPVIAGAGSNSTHEAVGFVSHAKKSGADAALVVTPYYNKPTQKGLYEHFKAVQDVGLPIVIYNIPGRSIVDMQIETMCELAKLPHIVGVKDATADLTRPQMTRAAMGNPHFCHLSGEDSTALPFLAAGGHGCISVTANIAPRLCADMQRAWRSCDIKTCMILQDQLMPLHNAMFCETNPGPVKYAAKLLGKCSAEVRLPMTDIAESSKQVVRDALVGTGLLN